MMLLRQLCPLCGGTISEDALRSGLPCNKCIQSLKITLRKDRAGISRFMLNSAVSSDSFYAALEPIIKIIARDELKDFEDFFHR